MSIPEIVRPDTVENTVADSPINIIFVGCVVKELHCDATSNPVVEEFEFTEKTPESSKLPDPNRLQADHFKAMSQTVREAVANDEQVTF